MKKLLPLVLLLLPLIVWAQTTAPMCGTAGVHCYPQPSTITGSNNLVNSEWVEGYRYWGLKSSASGYLMAFVAVQQTTQATPVPTVTTKPTPTPIASAADVIVDPSKQYQIITRWEANAQTAQDYTSLNYRAALADKAVNDLGLNGLRVELSNKKISGSAITTTGTDGLDSQMTKAFLPLRDELAKRGERAFLNVCFVNFDADKHLRDNPSQYAQVVLNTYKYLQSKYGVTPNSWEVILEPDTSTAQWGPSDVMRAIKAAGDLLKANGFTPSFIAPSVTAAARFGYYVDALTDLTYVSELSYHRYDDPTDATITGIGSRSRSAALPASMLERIGADYNTLHQDLKLANVSAWQQYCEAALKSWDDGTKGEAYFIVNDSTGAITLSPRAKFLRHYFRYVRSGAVRVAATSTQSGVDPVAFINQDGRAVVVARVKSNGAAFTVGGLPAGTYGIRTSNDAAQDVAQSDQTISGVGDAVKITVQGVGLVTVYQE